jgi:hypothetical protein
MNGSLLSISLGLGIDKATIVNHFLEKEGWEKVMKMLTTDWKKYSDMISFCWDFHNLFWVADQHL